MWTTNAPILNPLEYYSRGIIKKTNLQSQKRKDMIANMNKNYEILKCNLFRRHPEIVFHAEGSLIESFVSFFLNWTGA